ncbi:MAG: hypothetical protein AAF597_07840 [Bacteroidota bacterium]
MKPSEHLSKQDPVLGRIIGQVELPDLPSSRGVYHDLVSCIVDQTVPSRSRGVYMRKLVGLLGGDQPDPNNIYTIQEDDWAIAKMANPKYHTLFRVTDWWHETKVATWDWGSLSDQEVGDRLTAIKGIGPQTADLILLYSLGRADVLPVNDYHLKQIMPVLYDFDPEEKLPKQMLTVGEQWRPYRSVGTRYLLAYKSIMKR